MKKVGNASPRNGGGAVPRNSPQTALAQTELYGHIKFGTIIDNGWEFFEVDSSLYAIS